MTMSKGSGHLGDLLVRAGLITDVQLKEAVRRQQASPSYVPLGRVLVQCGFVSQQRLDVLLKNAKKRPRLGELLVSNGTLTSAQLAHALERQSALHLPLGQVLIRLGYATEQTMRDALTLQMNMRVIARMLDRGTRTGL